jgi:hypothetical protein
MCKELFFKVILVTTLIITSQRILHAQYHLGVEAGATVSSFYSTPQEPKMSEFIRPAIGARVGVFFESQIKDFFAIKTGIFGALKGTQFKSGDRWSLVYLTLPVLAIFTPVKPLKLGIGVELGALVSDSHPLLTDNKLSLGIRGEIAWQINPSFRLIAHSTIDVTPTFSVTYTDDQGNPLTQINNNNITGGLSLAYTIKTFDKKG